MYGCVLSAAMDSVGSATSAAAAMLCCAQCMVWYDMQSRERTARAGQYWWTTLQCGRGRAAPSQAVQQHKWGVKYVIVRVIQNCTVLRVVLVLCFDVLSLRAIACPRLLGEYTDLIDHLQIPSWLPGEGAASVNSLNSLRCRITHSPQSQHFSGL